MTVCVGGGVGVCVCVWVGRCVCVWVCGWVGVWAHAFACMGARIRACVLQRKNDTHELHVQSDDSVTVANCQMGDLFLFDLTMKTTACNNRLAYQYAKIVYSRMVSRSDSNPIKIMFQ